MVISEHFCNTVSIDETSGLISAGKAVFNVKNIRSVVVSDNCIVQFGKKDGIQGDATPVIGFDLDIDIPQPGRLFHTTKSQSLLIKPKSMVEALAFVSIINSISADLDKSGSFIDDFSSKTCIVEAKKGCNNYIRGGSLGSRPYSKPGLLAPIISPEYNLKEGKIKIIYVGTNASNMTSAWFSEHPEDDFLIADSTKDTFAVNLFEGKTETTAIFENFDIERDENATGLWQINLNQTHKSVCDALIWINTLQFAKHPDAIEKPSNNSPETQMLLGALNLLLQANKLTGTEYEKIKSRIMD